MRGRLGGVGARRGRPDVASLQDVERLRPSPASSPHRGHLRGVHARGSTPRNAHRLALPPLPRRRRSAATNWTTRPGPVSTASHYGSVKTRVYQRRGGPARFRRRDIPLFDVLIFFAAVVTSVLLRESA